MSHSLLGRKVGEAFCLNDDVKVEVLAVDKYGVQMGISDLTATANGKRWEQYLEVTGKVNQPVSLPYGASITFLRKKGNYARFTLKTCSNTKFYRQETRRSLAVA